MNRLKVYCDPLGGFVDLPAWPRRIVSLASGFTEAILHLGHGERLVGVSLWCPNFLPPGLELPVVGDYLRVEEEALRALEPDLVLLTTGVQRGLARKLYKRGFPVYALPLPNSLHGVLENLITLGALLDDLPGARALAQRWAETFAAYRREAPHPRPRVYVELWFGRHPRMAGGLSFVHDLVEAAGGENIFGGVRRGYLPLDLEAVDEGRPDLFILHSEPEYPVRAKDLLRERGWRLPYIEADVRPERNLIHDGPSMLRALAWLHGEIRCRGGMVIQTPDDPGG